MLPRIFESATVHVLGGGPSLTRETCDALRGLHAIAINSTIRLAPWVECMFFMDFAWFRDHRGIVDPFTGIAVTASRRAKKALHRLHLVTPPVISAEPLTAGHHAIDVAAAMGASKIILHGYDCRTIDGRSHCHTDYPMQWTDGLYRDRILPLWRGWGERMRRKGVDVVNASPDSAIGEFPAASPFANVVHRPHMART